MRHKYGHQKEKGKGGKYSEKEKVMTVKQTDKQHFLLLTRGRGVGQKQNTKQKTSQITC